MSVEREPSYETVLQTVIEQTRAGKLRWHKTAEFETYIASAKGMRSFELTTRRTADEQPADAVARPPQPPRLIVKDEFGDAVLEILSPTERLSELHYAVLLRMTSNVDEEVNKTVDVLRQL